MPLLGAYTDAFYCGVRERERERETERFKLLGTSCLFPEGQIVDEGRDVDRGDAAAILSTDVDRSLVCHYKFAAIP